MQELYIVFQELIINGWLRHWLLCKTNVILLMKYT